MCFAFFRIWAFLHLRDNIVSRVKIWKQEAIFSLSWHREIQKISARYLFTVGKKCDCFMQCCQFPTPSNKNAVFLLNSGYSRK